MPTEVSHGVAIHPTKTDPKNLSTVLSAEDLRPLPMPMHALRGDSSPEQHPIDCHDPILEEDGDTGSEFAEPITPTTDSHPESFQDQHPNANRPPAVSVSHNNPLVISTSPPALSTPRPPPTSKTVLPTTQNSVAVNPPVRPTVKKTPSKIRSFFRRTSSQQTTSSKHDVLPPQQLETRPVSSQSGNVEEPASRSTNNSPMNSVSTPLGSPSSATHNNPMLPQNLNILQEAFKRPNRSSTGISLKAKSRVAFGPTPKPERVETARRSNSVTDLNKERNNQPDISIPAQAGSGLKARRLSTSLPDDFFVDTCELNDEFSSASKIPGRKKQVGAGATSTVRVMIRKGDSGGRQYAVKEFRKQSQKENEQEYEKKVKSEFTIAQSLHHQNIVETARLCTHLGRWNHVMEYCQQGDIFSLMEQKYLKHEDHYCFFKQLLQGVCYLHGHGIAHRDIKLENLLMNNDGQIKITDFGVSEVFCGVHPGMRIANGECGKDMKECRLCAPGICGSLPYIAPEVLAKKGSYDPRPLDVWSCAIVFLTMWHGGSPWPAADPRHSLYQKFAAGWSKFIADHPDGFIKEDTVELPKVGPIISTLPNQGIKRVLLQMLHPDPDKRISIQQAVHTRPVKGIDCCWVDEQLAGGHTGGIDAAGKMGCKVAAKMVIKKYHNHLPPEKKLISSLPQHRFDVGDVYP